MMLEIWTPLKEYLAHFWVSSIFQIIAAILYMIAYWKKKNSLLVLVCACCCLFAISYALASAWDGVVLSICTLLAAVFARSNDEQFARYGATNRGRDILQAATATALTALMIAIVDRLNLGFHMTYRSWIVVIAAALEYTTFFLFRTNGITFNVITVGFHILLVWYEAISSVLFLAFLDGSITISVALRICSLAKTRHTPEPKAPRNP